MQSFPSTHVSGITKCAIVLFGALGIIGGCGGGGGGGAPDKTPPAAPVISSPVTGTLTNNNLLSILGTAEANSTVEVFVDGTSIGTVVVTAGGTWTFTPSSALADALGQILTATATDAAGNISLVSTGVSLDVDSTAPGVTDVTSTTPDNSFTVGGAISITVTFDEIVNVTGTPQLTLDSGGVVDYTSGDGTTVLTFDYTVGAGENSADLGYPNATSLALNGGSIMDAAANPVSMTLPTPGGIGSLSSNKNLIVDTAGPVVIDIDSPTASSLYGPGDLIVITVQFDENVVVGGSPTLTLNNTAVVPVTSAATDTMTFNYTVGVTGSGEDEPTGLDNASTTALALAGGLIRDALGNDAPLTLPAPGAAGSLSTNKGLWIDTTAPTLIDVTATNTDGVYGPTDLIVVRVTFDEPVDATGTPELALNNGGTAFYAVSAVSSIKSFGYTVGALGSGEDVLDLDYATTSALTLAGGSTITDPAGNVAVIALPALAGAGSLGFNKDLEVDVTAPSVVNVSATNPDGPLIIGETLTVAVEFNEPVFISTVTGAMQLALDFGAFAAYSGGLNTNTLTFDYTVVAGDSETDVDYLAAGSITGFTLRDLAFNDADMTLPTPGGTGSLAFNKDIDLDGTQTVITQVQGQSPDGSYKDGDTVLIDIQFDTTVTITGTPFLLLDSGPFAPYVSGDGTNTLTFSNTITIGENSNDLDYVDVDSLNLTVGTISGANGNPIIKTLPLKTSGNSLAERSDIIVDTTPPVGTVVDKSVTGTPTTMTGTYTDTGSGVVSVDVTVGLVTYPAVLGAPVAGTGNWTVNITDAFPAGFHGVMLTITDDAGNVSFPGVSGFLFVDQVNPVIWVDPLVQQSGAAGTVTLTGSYWDDNTIASIDITVNSIQYPATFGAAVWSLTVPDPLPNGSGETFYEVQADIVDAVGNAGTDTTTFELELDVNAPTGSALTPTAGQANVDLLTDVRIQFDDEMDDSTVNPTNFQVVEDLGGANTVLTPVSIGPEVDGSGYVFRVPGGTLMNGLVYEVTIVGGVGGVADAAGNEQVGDVVYTFTAGATNDSTPPAFTRFETVNSDPHNSKTVDFSYDVTDFGGSGVYDVLFKQNATPPIETDFFGGSFPGSYTITGADGTYTIYAWAIDNATPKNISLVAATLTIDIDTLDPPVPVITTADPTVTNDVSPNIAGTIGENPVTIELQFDNGGPPQFMGGGTASSGTWDFDSMVLLPPDTYSIAARSRDAAGNTSAFSTPITLTIDLAAPAAPAFTGTTPTSADTVDTTPDIEGTAEADSTVQLFTDSNCTSPIGAPTVATGGIFSINVTVGSNTSTDFWATATDVAGNTSPCSTTSINYTHDDTTPKPVITLPTALATTGSNPLVAGTSEALADIEVFVNDGGGPVSMGTATADAAGDWDTSLLTPFGLANLTSYTLTVEATDALGNGPVASDPVQINVNYPYVTGLWPQGPCTSAGTTIVIDFDQAMDEASVEADFVLTEMGVGPVTVIKPFIWSNGSRTATITPDPDGSGTLSNDDLLTSGADHAVTISNASVSANSVGIEPAINLAPAFTTRERVLPVLTNILTETAADGLLGPVPVADVTETKTLDLVFNETMVPMGTVASATSHASNDEITFTTSQPHQLCNGDGVRVTGIATPDFNIDPGSGDPGIGRIDSPTTFTIFLNRTLINYGTTDAGGGAFTREDNFGGARLRIEGSTDRSYEGDTGGFNNGISLAWTAKDTLTVTLDSGTDLPAGSSWMGFLNGVSDAARNNADIEFILQVEQSMSVDPTGPTVISTVPANLETGVNNRQVIVINFDELVAFATLSGIQISDTGATMDESDFVIEQDVEDQSTSIFMIPTRNYPDGTTVTVSIPTTVTDLAGNALTSALAFSFDVGVAASGDNNAPIIQNTFPADGSVVGFVNEMQVSLIDSGTFAPEIIDALTLGLADVDITDSAGIVRGLRPELDSFRPDIIRLRSDQQLWPKNLSDSLAQIDVTGTTVLYTTQSAHTIQVGQAVWVGGVTNNDLNVSPSGFPTPSPLVIARTSTTFTIDIGFIPSGGDQTVSGQGVVWWEEPETYLVRVSIGGGIADMSGNAMAEDSFTFDVAPFGFNRFAGPRDLFVEFQCVSSPAYKSLSVWGEVNDTDGDTVNITVRGTTSALIHPTDVNETAGTAFGFLGPINTGGGGGGNWFELGSDGPVDMNLDNMANPNYDTSGIYPFEVDFDDGFDVATYQFDAYVWLPSDVPEPVSVDAAAVSAVAPLNVASSTPDFVWTPFHADADLAFFFVADTSVFGDENGFQMEMSIGLSDTSMTMPVAIPAGIYIWGVAQEKTAPGGNGELIGEGFSLDLSGTNVNKSLFVYGPGNASLAANEYAISKIGVELSDDFANGGYTIDTRIQETATLTFDGVQNTAVADREDNGGSPQAGFAGLYAHDTLTDVLSITGDAATLDLASQRGFTSRDTTGPDDLIVYSGAGDDALSITVGVRRNGRTDFDQDDLIGTEWVVAGVGMDNSGGIFAHVGEYTNFVSDDASDGADTLHGRFDCDLLDQGGNTNSAGGEEFAFAGAQDGELSLFWDGGSGAYLDRAFIGGTNSDLGVQGVNGASTEYITTIIAKKNDLTPLGVDNVAGITGTYNFTFIMLDGSTGPPPDVRDAFAGRGTITFDGAGGYTYVESSGETGGGSYKVNDSTSTPSGSGYLVLDGSAAGGMFLLAGPDMDTLFGIDVQTSGARQGQLMIMSKQD